MKPNGSERLISNALGDRLKSRKQDAFRRSKRLPARKRKRRLKDSVCSSARRRGRRKWKRKHDWLMSRGRQLVWRSESRKAHPGPTTMKKKKRFHHPLPRGVTTKSEAETSTQLAAVQWAAFHRVTGTWKTDGRTMLWMEQGCHLVVSHQVVVEIGGNLLEDLVMDLHAMDLHAMDLYSMDLRVIANAGLGAMIAKDLGAGVTDLGMDLRGVILDGIATDRRGVTLGATVMGLPSVVDSVTVIVAHPAVVVVQTQEVGGVS
mmetsp:Transcript_36838/g.60995  ORF Transcript_36838/g.60995 Transcript_36838/m.60995 type:complete len:261 (+) Transcript_36838:2500-3282(+)